jgi:hypothetical protein
LWATPAVADARRGWCPEPTKQGRCLAREVQLFPTPVAGDSRAAMNRLSKRKPDSNHHEGTTLTDFVRMFPVPTESARDWKGPGYSGQLPTELRGVPNPAFVEWLLGLPPSWTDLEDSATPSSPR